MTKEEEYKLFVQQVNNLTNRRQTVTSVYLTVNSGIVGALAFLLADAQMSQWACLTSVGILIVSGIVACSLWRKLISQYSTLLGWWYEQLRDLEDAMTRSNQLLTCEYKDLYSGEKRTTKVGLTRYEIQLTWLFTVLHLSFGVWLSVAGALGLL